MSNIKKIKEMALAIFIGIGTSAILADVGIETYSFSWFCIGIPMIVLIWKLIESK